MVEDNAARFALKTELLLRIEKLGLQQSLFPSSDELIDQLVQQLEDISPILQPLQPNDLPSLLGNWQLVYASAGTVVTRQIASIPDFLGGIKIKRVWQRLASVNNIRKISASNSAQVELPILGEWQLQANGHWKWDTDEKTATVSFNSFSIQATKPFGLSNWSFPELKIPVLEFLQREALWITSYLDQEIRVGRGVTGNLFVFRRDITS
ncbi:PAP fibrillin [Nostoc sp. UCD121]|uniref:PAP/fibrillin family protein n=1 Tax=unclassified Nostoc TaxID=2593658 RepID=UPI0013D07CAC|nr:MULTISPECIES: PAP/fibrillin family protein [unclassified Nostoc]MBC1225173.1 PAP fibrillin [Nostoc sp. UCD120]MBC1278910.1 PAP fibrillin [Nostoc sp. UCD121]MBC1297940.1 PAP fibrillin [Nostoc sp. UCD122]NEU83065.1 PAP fibrillin [Nostoc sp. UIC 10630]